MKEQTHIQTSKQVALPVLTPPPYQGLIRDYKKANSKNLIERELMHKLQQLAKSY